mmetsp:Transcript_51795/g.148510  ORF Transcript_51795/g.148510 Transcript_51795/m.148510 type:complete len:92 (+) Transcript_51795:57-332(+)
MMHYTCKFIDSGQCNAFSCAAAQNTEAMSPKAASNSVVKKPQFPNTHALNERERPVFDANLPHRFWQIQRLKHLFLRSPIFTSGKKSYISS